MQPTPQDPIALFLDDDADVLAAAALLLKRQAIGMLGAQSPEAAEAIFAERAVDVLLLDLNFRRGDTSGEAGLAFLEKHMAARPHIPVIVVTGHSGIAIAVKAMRMGAEDFVVKPWHNERFIAQIRAAIASPRHLARPPEDLNLERSEKDLIKQALTRHQFNISQAARDLGLTRAALYRRMEKHGL